jgi:hypothetical protein
VTAPNPYVPAPYRLIWYAADASSGGIIEELTSLSSSQPLSRRLGQSVNGSLSLAIAGAPPAWQSATQHGRTMLVAVDELTNTPIWCGITLVRTRGSDPAASITTLAPEGYLDRRYTGTYVTTSADKAGVLAALVNPAFTNGLPFVLDAPAIGETMAETVQDSDDVTCLSAAQTVMGQDGGPEFTIDVAWNADQSGFVLPVRVRKAIGTQLASPQAVFDYPGCVTTYSQEESYESGKGGNVIMAYGDGAGTSRVRSDVYTSALVGQGWPEWVYRYTPSAATTDPVALNADAASALQQMEAGSSAWTITATASKAPRLGTEWGIGDTVRLSVAPAGPRFAGSSGHPDGVEVTARVWGWDLDPAADTVSPILVEGG